MKTFGEFCSNNGGNNDFNPCSGCVLDALDLDNIGQCEIAYGAFMLGQEKYKNCLNCSKQSKYVDRKDCLQDGTFMLCEK